MARAQDPTRARAAALKVLRTLRAQGHIAYFAGGCVRDELLGLHPTDYDVATDAPPARVHALFPHAQLVGAAFGVMIVPIDGCAIEVATFRGDGAYSDTRRPDSVTFTDARNDAARRDFTINALFLDPEPATPDPTRPRSPLGGEVIDFVDGVRDLHAKVLRAVGTPDDRLREDHLRALRAVRFAARLSFEIESRTRHAIIAHAQALKGVSNERVGDELRRMLTHPTRAEAAQLMQELGLDAPAIETRSISCALNILRSLRLDDLPEADRPSIALAAWSLDRALIDQPQARSLAPEVIAQRTRHLRKHLCLSNDEAELFKAVLTQHAELIERWPDARIAQQKRQAARLGFEGGVRVLEAQSPAEGIFVRIRYGYLASIAMGIHPEPLVTGDDLIALGFKPGPAFKNILDRVYDEQLEGLIVDRAQALELVRRRGV
jgi:tRNA nucleotidyltransferase/poly(A) polymerase